MIEPIIEASLSLRDRYIIAQALVLGIQALTKVEPRVMREESNIEDMVDLLASQPFALFALAILQGMALTGDPVADTMGLFLDSMDAERKVVEDDRKLREERRKG